MSVFSKTDLASDNAFSRLFFTSSVTHVSLWSTSFPSSLVLSAFVMPSAFDIAASSSAKYTLEPFIGLYDSIACNNSLVALSIFSCVASLSANIFLALFNAVVNFSSTDFVTHVSLGSTSLPYSLVLSAFVKPSAFNIAASSSAKLTFVPFSGL